MASATARQILLHRVCVTCTAVALATSRKATQASKFAALIKYPLNPPPPQSSFLLWKPALKSPPTPYPPTSGPSHHQTMSHPRPTICGVVVSAGRMMKAVKVRTAKQVYNSFLRKVRYAPSPPFGTTPPPRRTKNPLLTLKTHLAFPNLRIALGFRPEQFSPGGRHGSNHERMAGESEYHACGCGDSGAVGAGD